MDRLGKVALHVSGGARALPYSTVDADGDANHLFVSHPAVLFPLWHALHASLLVERLFSGREIHATTLLCVWLDASDGALFSVAHFFLRFCLIGGMHIAMGQ